MGNSLKSAEQSKGPRVSSLVDEIGEPIIEYFRLEGVNGYKTIQLDCSASAKIVSAENGSGKTTLLNALYGILAGKPAQLHKVQFDQFAIKLREQDELRVSKGELTPLPADIIDVIDDSFPQLREFGRDDSAILEALTKLALGQTDEFFKSDWFDRFYRMSPFDRDDISTMCEELISGLPDSDSRFSEIEEYVRTGLGGATVLYLPTYRRIEAEMPSDIMQSKRSDRYYFNPRPKHPSRRVMGRRSRSSWEMDQLIYFGLEDVETRLRDIAELIRSGTFDAYTRIGGRTLEELLSGPGNLQGDPENIDTAELGVVLARLGKADGEVEARIAALINNGEINKPQHRYLRSFLSQLLEVYASNKEQEQAIEAFVGVINSYWENDFDEKRFIFDKLSVSTRVENKFTGNSLPLNALSSGEKQIVSIFARLYLSELKQFIVLIDEPELSLSMDWQMRFLPDILRSPSCAQMVAITHSPFVFDNELDPYAGPLKITNRRSDEGKKTVDSE
ncbi:AAA family ATPase [Cognatiyoonia sp. IB215182]|uniref:AAA family ATPase n=1 Tax=Cognatiyoonia sp. IB215182 TaxID=3097353 RepID=UPI002A0E0C70|nr:AAA family ATPase [Cognatiyoonia sp. IB215182]MDX8354347.1 AAA family ATPase [Cognatiyoonia sp. IB215182]